MLRRFSRSLSLSPWAAWLWAVCLLASPAVLRADEAEDQYAVAAGHYALKRWSLAAESFAQLLKEHPDSPRTSEAVYYLGESLLMQGQLAEAEVQYRRYLQREPEGRLARSALFRAGESLYLTGKYAQAKADLERFHARFGSDALNEYALPYLGEISLNEADAAAAANYFKEGLTRYPEGHMQDECRLGLARARERQGQTEEAERLYLALAAKPLSPVAADAQHYLGYLLYKQNRFAEAVKVFEDLEKQWPRSARVASARLGRSWALLKLDRVDDAQRLLQTITADRQVGIVARYWLGMAEKMHNDFATAAKTLAAAAEADPRHELAPALHYQAGDALVRVGDYPAAVRQFDQVLAAGPAAHEWADQAARSKILAQAQAKQYAALDKLVAEFPQRFPQSTLQSEVDRLWVRSLIERKEFARAVAALEPRLARSRPQDNILVERYLLALGYEGLKRYNDALAALLPVVDAGPGPMRGDALRLQGLLLAALRHYGEATGPLEAALAAGSQGEDAQRAQAELAICYARTAKLDKAKQAYGRLLQQKPPKELLSVTTQQLSEAAYEAHDPAWASELFGHLAHEGQTPQVQLEGLSGLAWAKYKAGDLKEAADVFQQLLQKDPGPKLGAEAALARGRILEQLDRADAALAMYDMVSQRWPQSPQYPQSLLAAARLRARLHQNREAAELFALLVDKFPQWPELDAVLYDWSWALQDAGSQAEAVQLLERIHGEFRRSRYWPDVTYRLAQRAVDAKDNKRAAQLAGELLKANTEPRIREYALYMQGQLAAGQEQWDQVRPALEPLLREFPNSALRLPAEYWLAEATYRQGDYDAAGQRFERLAQSAKGQQQPWLGMVALRRAQIRAQMHKWDEAQSIAATIEKEYPNFEQQYEADYVLGRCLAAQADFEGARRLYQKVIHSPRGGKTETAAMAQWMVGESYFHQKNYQAAVKEYLRLEILYAYPTWQSGALLQAGKCYELLGQWKEAVDQYDRLLQVYPKTTFAEEARRRLQPARGHLKEAPNQP